MNSGRGSIPIEEFSGNALTPGPTYMMKAILQFKNFRIERRFQQAQFQIQTSSIKILWISFLLLFVCDLFVQGYLRLTLIAQIIATGGFIFVLHKKIVLQKSLIQVLSIILDIYIVIRLRELNIPFEVIAGTLVVSTHIHLVSWWQTSVLLVSLIPIGIEVDCMFEGVGSPQCEGKENQSNMRILMNQIGQAFSNERIIWVLIGSLMSFIVEFKLRDGWRIIDQLTRSQRQYNSLFFKSDTPILIVNNSGYILEYNEKSQGFFKRNRNNSFYDLIQDKEEQQAVKQAIEKVHITKETVYVRANLQFTQSFISQQSLQQAGSMLLGNNSPSIASRKNSISKQPTITGFGQPNIDSTTISAQTGVATRLTAGGRIPSSQASAVAPPQISAKNQVQKYDYPFTTDQFDDQLKEKFLEITSNKIDAETAYYSIAISPIVWKESVCLLVQMTDFSETKDFVKVSNFFLKNLNDRLVSVLNHTEIDFYKWSNLVVAGTIKTPDLRKLSEVISESHNIVILAQLMRYLNQMYIGSEKTKNQDFEIKNLIVQTIEAHSVRIQNFLKVIDLFFHSTFFEKVCGDPTAFCFIIYNLLYLMSLPCQETGVVDISLFCTFLTYIKNTQFVLQISMVFAATEQQIEFFQKNVSEFEKLDRFILQSDLKDKDIYETILLLTLNILKLNDGVIRLEEGGVNPPKNIDPMKQPKEPAIPKEKSSLDVSTPISTNQQDKKPLPKLKIVLECLFSSPEIQNVKNDNRQQNNQKSANSSTTNHHTLLKPGQFNLSFTRTQEQNSAQYYWRPQKLEEKKIKPPDIGTQRRQDIHRVKQIQDFGQDSEENIHLPINRGDGISPLIPGKSMRKSSTNVSNLQIGDEQGKVGIIHSTSIQQIPQIQQGVSQLQSKDSSNSLPRSSHQIVAGPSQQQLPQSQVMLFPSSFVGEKKKSLENISESAENIDREKKGGCEGEEEVEDKHVKIEEISSDASEYFINSCDQLQSIAAYGQLDKQVRQYLKLYNSNIVKDLSKIIQTILSSSKIQDEADIKLINNSKIENSPLNLLTGPKKKSKSGNNFFNPQFSSPQLPPRNFSKTGKKCQQVPLHSAFKDLVNPEKASAKNNIRKKSANIQDEQTPKSVGTSRPPKSKIFSMSPQVTLPLRFQQEPKLEYGKSLSNIVQDVNESIHEIYQISKEVMLSRQKKHIRKWVLTDIWNRFYKKTDTVLVVLSDQKDKSKVIFVFQQMKDHGREVDFTTIQGAFQSYLQFLNQSEVHKYILIDLRIQSSEIQKFINDVKLQEEQSSTIPKMLIVGFQGSSYQQYPFTLDLQINGSLDSLKLAPIIKTIKQRKQNE